MSSKLQDSEMSMVSKKYDRGNKGFLDETEQQLREMDTENTGHVSNEKVYELVKSNMEAQRNLYKTKRILFCVVIFALLLAATTLATSIAAAELSKDSSVSKRSSDFIDEDELMTKDGSAAIGMHTIGHTIQLEEHDHGGGLADHACVAFSKVGQVWEEIATEFEVHLILVKYDITYTNDAKGLKDKLMNEDMIPLTGAKSTDGQLCFTSFNEIAACIDFDDTSCSTELGDEEIVTMTFPNSAITSK